MNDNRCVICGEQIPEGRQVCPICERKNYHRDKVDYWWNEWILPIGLFAAILDGRKTQTRRLVKDSLLFHSCEDEDSLWIEDENGDYWRAEEYAPVQPGDKLYVRETWKMAIRKFEPFPRPTVFLFKAGEQREDPTLLPENKWRPSIHMPKHAARIWLRVKDVRCERLQDITEEDAEKEGLYKGWKLAPNSSAGNSARQAFMWLWDTTTDRGSFYKEWAGNPWVWVIEFERIEGPTP